MEQMIRLIKEYKSLVFYGIFGVMTTIVNLVVYNLCYYKLGIGNTISNIFAWIFAVTFAYITNKSLVFESKSWEWNVLKREISAFISCRFATGIMDIMIMFVCVDIIGWYAMLMKIISNVLVIVLNYIFSKLVIFKNK